MAKYCGNCGTQMDDGAKVCSNCGTALKPTNGNSNPNMKKIITVAVAAIAAVIVIAVAGSVISKNTGVNGAIKKVMKAYVNEDATAMADLTSSLLLEEYDLEDIEENYETALRNDFDYFDDNLSSEYKLTYEVRKEEKLSDRQAKRLAENIAGYDDDEADDIADLFSKIMKVTVKISAEEKRGKNKDTESLEKTLYFVKESGGWKLLSFQFYQY